MACRVFTAVIYDNFGVCVDIWNIWQNTDVVQEIKAYGARVFVAQVSY